jgi:serine-type D-Ala-D-Ala carboxypeptidase (penicillin-binding protein 5/6)
MDNTTRPLPRPAAILMAAFIVALLASTGGGGCVFDRPDTTVSPDFRPAARVAVPLGDAGDFPDAPRIGASSAIMIDALTGRTLYEKNADRRMPVASTQKLLTALTVLEEGGLDRLAGVTMWDELQPPTKLYLHTGETYSRRELLAAMLVSSANDAASVLAGSAAGTYEDFIARMNDKARRLGARDSMFLNPHGLDAPGQHSTARDAAIIAYHAYHHPFIRHYAAQEWIAFTHTDGRTEILDNTNQLVFHRPARFNGLKGGFTIQGGKCLVASAKDDGGEIIIVLLNGTRSGIFDDAERLHRWQRERRRAATNQGSQRKFSRLILRMRFLASRERGPSASAMIL